MQSASVRASFHRKDREGRDKPQGQADTDLHQA